MSSSLSVVNEVFRIQSRRRPNIILSSSDLPVSRSQSWIRFWVETSESSRTSSTSATPTTSEGLKKTTCYSWNTPLSTASTITSSPTSTRGPGGKSSNSFASTSTMDCAKPRKTKKKLQKKMGRSKAGEKKAEEKKAEEKRAESSWVDRRRARRGSKIVNWAQ